MDNMTAAQSNRYERLKSMGYIKETTLPDGIYVTPGELICSSHYRHGKQYAIINRRGVVRQRKTIWHGDI